MKTSNNGCDICHLHASVLVLSVYLACWLAKLFLSLAGCFLHSAIQWLVRPVAPAPMSEEQIAPHSHFTSKWWLHWKYWLSNLLKLYTHFSMFMHPKHHSSGAAFLTETSIEEKTKTCTDWCHPTYHDDNKLFICASRHIINTGSKEGTKNLEWEEVFGSLTFAVIIGRSCHKYHFCCNKSFVVTNTCLSWQNTSFVMTKVCLSWQIFVVTSFVATCLLLLRQTCLSWQNMSFVPTKVCLS